MGVAYACRIFRSTALLYVLQRSCGGGHYFWSDVILGALSLKPPAWLQGEALEAAEAARIFEGQLAGALVAEDGQLALSTLAASAAHGFMPRIQTQGQLGQARWRFVSAPSIPGAPRPSARGTAPANYAWTDSGGGIPNVAIV